VPQVEGTVIVDNTPQSEIHSQFRHHPWWKKVHVMPQQKNIGLGAAQNIGIGWAKASGFQYILLMDQDSTPSDNMVSRLKAASGSLHSSGVPVAAVGPKIVNIHTGLALHFVRFGWLIFKRIYCSESSENIVPVDLLFASGSLISLRVLEEVGWMDEDLFIDYVDTDWYLRAISKGLRSFGVCDASLSHGLGEGSIRVWLGGWRNPPRHEPIRLYYMFRNSLRVYGRQHAGIKWIINDAVRLFKRFGYYSFFVAPRAQYFSMMVKGIFHGILNKDGPYKGYLE